MKLRTRVLGWLASMFVIAAVASSGCNQGMADPMPVNPPGPDDTAVVVNIIGSGSVRYVNQMVADCVGTSNPDFPSLCDPVVVRGGGVLLDAIPASGWRFDHWTVGSFSPSNLQIITDPMNPMQMIVGGTRVLLIAVFASTDPSFDPSTLHGGCVQSGSGSTSVCPANSTFTIFDGLEVGAIQATFDAEARSTTYTVRILNPEEHVLAFQWSGPNCGTWGSQDQTRTALAQPPAEMTWSHPHPPCDPTTDHSDVTVVFSLTDRATGAAIRCTYQGAATGVGPACMRM